MENLNDKTFQELKELGAKYNVTSNSKAGLVNKLLQAIANKEVTPEKLEVINLPLDDMTGLPVIQTDTYFHELPKTDEDGLEIIYTLSFDAFKDLIKTAIGSKILKVLNYKNLYEQYLDSDTSADVDDIVNFVAKKVL